MSPLQIAVAIVAGLIVLMLVWFHGYGRAALHAEVVAKVELELAYKKGVLDGTKHAAEIAREFRIAMQKGQL